MKQLVELESTHTCRDKCLSLPPIPAPTTHTFSHASQILHFHSNGYLDSKIILGDYQGHNRSSGHKYMHLYRYKWWERLEGFFFLSLTDFNSYAKNTETALSDYGQFMCICVGGLRVRHVAVILSSGMCLF